MKAFLNPLWIGMLFYLATLVVIRGQTTNSASASVSTSSPSTIASASAVLSASQAQTLLQTFETEQLALLQEKQALLNQGATAAQLEAWDETNAARLAAQQQRSLILAMNSARRPVPIIAASTGATNASPSVQGLLGSQTTLAASRVQIHNQLVQPLTASATVGQVSDLQQQEDQQFQQQNAATLQLQAQQAQTLANQSDQTAIPLPPPLVLPPNCSPHLAAFLTARDQLMRDEIQNRNQNLSPDPAVREAAMEQWVQNNLARIQQVQQLAAALSTNPQ